MDIDFIFDTVCIWSFIAKRRLEKAMAAFPDQSFSVSAHPLNIAPPDEFFPFDLKMRADCGERTRALRDRIEPYLIECGIPVAFHSLPAVQSVFPSHTLVRRGFSENKGMETLESVFQAYFCLARDIGKTYVLLEIAEENGLDVAAFQHDLSAPQPPVFPRKEGVRGVPAFIFGKKLLISGAQSTNSFIRLIQTALIVEKEGMNK